MKKKCTALFTTIASWIPRLSFSLVLVSVMDAPLLAQVREIKEVEIVKQPQVQEDEITVRVKLQGKENKPVVPLKPEDFTLSVRKQLSRQNWSEWNSLEAEDYWQSWKSPDEAVQVPIWMIFLLDFSGSMTREDSRGVEKFTGAINAIRRFNDFAAENLEGNIQISVVPFGIGGSQCAIEPIDNEQLDRFLPIGDFKLTNYLDNLEKRSPCASTDIYTPLKKVIRFFGNPYDERFSPAEREVSEENFQAETTTPQPQLAIILLSDGYHNAGNDKQNMAELKELIAENQDIVIHTLGYGLTPTQLGNKYNLGRPAFRGDINEGTVKAGEFVDKQLLDSIAEMTGGIGEFSADADVIAQQLPLFLKALLGEYEITYTDPIAERGSTHEVRVGITSPATEEIIYSEAKRYRVTVFGRSLPLSIRLGILLGTLFILGIGGVLPFYFWGKWLKRAEN
ncbi:MAG: VWA domain-containing protein [Cyanobacteria bacterium]|jgi:hypothetical protein|nr:VWA domain-containing protein [Cyanobacteria bacterium GSL.Bin21]